MLSIQTCFYSIIYSIVQFWATADYVVLFLKIAQITPFILQNKHHLSYNQ